MALPLIQASDSRALATSLRAEPERLSSLARSEREAGSQGNSEPFSAGTPLEAAMVFRARSRIKVLLERHYGGKIGA